MGYIIEISDSKIDKMSEYVEDMLWAGGELMHCLEKIKGEQGYGHRGGYGMRSGQGSQGGRYSGGSQGSYGSRGGYGYGMKEDEDWEEMEEMGERRRRSSRTGRYM